MAKNDCLKQEKKAPDSIAYWDDFSRPKIAWGNLNLKASFAWVEPDVYICAPCPLIAPPEKWILAYLNSKIADFYIRNLGVTRNGGYFEYKPMFVQELRMPTFSNSIKSRMNQLTNNIKTNTELLDIEYEIDNTIFNFFELSQSEIKYLL